MNEGKERENRSAEDQQVQSGLTVQEVVGNVLAFSGHVARTETFGGDEESSRVYAVIPAAASRNSNKVFLLFMSAASSQTGMICRQALVSYK